MKRKAAATQPRFAYVPRWNRTAISTEAAVETATKCIQKRLTSGKNNEIYKKSEKKGWNQIERKTIKITQLSGGRLRPNAKCFDLKCCNNNCHKLNSCHDLRRRRLTNHICICIPDRCGAGHKWNWTASKVSRGKFDFWQVQFSRFLSCLFQTASVGHWTLIGFYLMRATVTTKRDLKDFVATEKEKVYLNGLMYFKIYPNS